jgi:hypothetical protein
VASGGDLGRDADRLEEVLVVGDVLPGDVERRPVPGRRADQRQADEQRHDRPEAEELHRHEALVVVERERQVERAVSGLQEDGVGRERPLRVDAAGARGGDRGHDLVALLGAEGAFLPRVRVEPGDREPRARDPHVAQRRVGEHEPVEDAVLPHVVADRAERHVVREEHEAHPAEEQEHRGLRSGELAEYLGLPLVAMPGGVHRLLVERRRHHRVDLARDRHAARLARVWTAASPSAGLTSPQRCAARSTFR